MMELYEIGETITVGEDTVEIIGRNFLLEESVVDILDRDNIVSEETFGNGLTEIHYRGGGGVSRWIYAYGIEDGVRYEVSLIVGGRLREVGGLPFQRAARLICGNRLNVADSDGGDGMDSEDKTEATRTAYVVETRTKSRGFAPEEIFVGFPTASSRADEILDSRHDVEEVRVQRWRSLKTVVTCGRLGTDGSDDSCGGGRE